jgi:hypothetical protein
MKAAFRDAMERRIRAADGCSRRNFSYAHLGEGGAFELASSFEFRVSNFVRPKIREEKRKAVRFTKE